jgi:hypothetical protein
VIESIRIPAQQTTTKEKICNNQWFNLNFYEANSVVFAFFLFLSVLGILDILVRYLWLMDPDTTPDPAPFFINFKDGKKKYFFPIFSYNLPTGTSFSV